MVRAPFYDKNGMKRGAWSAEEDHKLRSYVLKYGHWNWREIPRFAGLKRCGKSCRLRWKNYLQPELKHGNFTEEENAMIMKLHEEFGNRWSMIAAKLHGRTDNEIKNHWHTHLKKLAKRNLTKSDQEKEDCSTVTSQSDATLLNCSEGEAESICFDSPPNMILESSSLSPSASSESVDVVDDICLPSSFTLDNGSISDFSNTVLTDDVSIPSTFSPDNGSISISDFDIDFMDDVFLPSSVTPDCGLSVSDFTIGDVCDLHSSQTLHEINQSSGDLWREFFEEDNINNNQDGYHIPISSTVRNEFEQPILPFDMYLDDSANLLYQVMQEWS